MIPKATFQRYTRSPEAFRNDLLVDVDGVARKFGEVQDDWQSKDFTDLDPALLRVTGRSNELARMRAYWERGRGHDKTSGIATEVIYLLAFANRPLKGYCFAADKDQAGLLKDAIATKIRLNPWIGDLLTVQKDQVVTIAEGHPAKGGSLTIFTSDVGSSYGILPDFIVCDELTHWTGDGSLWHSIISSAAKRSNCLMLIIANAGFCDSWQWTVREAIRNDPNWIFSRLDGPVASWITPDRLEEQQKMLPPIAYLRLWGNQWSSGGGDALRPEDINACFYPNLRAMEAKAPGWLFCAGVDLGLVRDASAVVVLAVPDRRWGKLRLADHKVWTPSRGQKVDLNEIEAYILELDRRFNLEQVGFDPWQAELLASRIEANASRRRRNQQRRLWAEPFMKEITPNASNLRDIANLTIEHFNDHRLELYDCPPLRRDLTKLRVEEKTYGIRLTSPRDETGHGDTFSAFANALMIGHTISQKRPTTAGVPPETKGLSPAERAMNEYSARLEREKEEWIKAQEAYHDTNEPLRELMRRCGRL